MPTVRSLAVPAKSCDAVAWYGPIPSEELNKGRSCELENLIEYEAFDEVHELPLGHKLSTWFGLTSGVETKSDHDRAFDSSKLNDHDMTSVLEHLKLFS